jgi:hypothetical protein
VWRSSTLGKVMLVSLALILVTAFGYVVYSVLFAWIESADLTGTTNRVLSHNDGPLEGRRQLSSLLSYGDDQAVVWT